MGHELVYCATCGNQLRGDDFAAGRAFRVDEQSYCAACASSLPPAPAEPAAPPRETKLRTGPLPRADTTRFSTSRVTRSIPREPVEKAKPRQKGALVPILCGVGAAAALVGVLALLLSGGGRAPASPSEARGEEKSAPPVAKPGETPAPPAAERKDLPEALRKARELRQSRPSDVAAQLQEYRKALMALDGTPFYAEARQELDAITAGLEQEAAALDAEIAAPLAKNDFAAALKTLEGARQKRDIPEWTLLVDKRMDDVYRRRKAAGLAPPPTDAAKVSPPPVSAAAPAGKPAPKPESKKPEPPKDPKEVAARELLDAADREFADMKTFEKAVEKYKVLLNDYPTVEFVRQSMKLILRRSEAGKEFLLSSAEVSAAGTFKRAKDEKAGDCWRSSADSDPDRGAKNYVEAEFYALPGTEYKAWVHAGACCAEKFSIDIQATDLTFTDPKSKKTYQLDPGGGAALPVPQKATFPKKTHAQHDPKKPDPHAWHWVSLPIPKYAAPGAKKIRLVTDREALSIAWVLVTSTRAAPPAEAEMKELAKERAAEPAAAKPKPAAVTGGLLAHLKFDEGKGATAADAAGKGRTGAIQGGAGWGAGKVGGALSLDGKDDSVKLEGAGLDVDTGSFTVAVWANVKEAKHVRLANKWDGSKKGWLFDLHGDRGGKAKVGNVRFVVGDGAKTVDVSLGANLPTGQWMHLAVVVDRAKGELNIYLNGSPVGGPQSAADQKGSCNSPAPLYVGSLGAAGFVSGLVDDFRLYNRALSDAEVKSLASGK